MEYVDVSLFDPLTFIFRQSNTAATFLFVAILLETNEIDI